MKIIIILVLLYSTSFALMWLYTHLVYSKKGKWKYISPDVEDLLITVLPIINTAALVFWICNFPVELGCRTVFNTSKFFRINK